LLASPQFLVAVRVGLPVPFVCNETHELGEKLVGPYRYQVHLLYWLESNVYGVFLSDNDLYIKVKRMAWNEETAYGALDAEEFLLSLRSNARQATSFVLIQCHCWLSL